MEEIRIIIMPLERATSLSVVRRLIVVVPLARTPGMRVFAGIGDGFWQIIAKDSVETTTPAPGVVVLGLIGSGVLRTH